MLRTLGFLRTSRSTLSKALALGLALPILPALVGCGGGQADSKQADLPAWMSDEKNAANKLTVRLANDTPSVFLGLNVKTGDMIPLRKIVQQELMQHSSDGNSQRSYSRLETMLAITVLDKVEERVRLGVRYNRVKYQHEVADEVVSFDSKDPQQHVTVATAAYRDMVNDGFSFWIGKDNQIVEAEGLADFIARSLRNVPEEHRSDVVLGIEATSGDDGIANFVDNTIGLLPYGKRTSPGDSWERQQHVARPQPMHVNNLFTLKELTPQQAVIDIRGTISPSVSLTNLNDPDLKVVVNGGHTLGSCVIYRDTGLPKESRIDRIVEMSVVSENQVKFRQTKRITTVIEAFPPVAGSGRTVLQTPNASGIQQVSGTR